MLRRTFLAATAGFAVAVMAVSPAHARDMWTKAEANAWYAKQDWMVGANYNPRTAINQFEMWQRRSPIPTARM